MADADPVTGLTPKDKQLIRQSWAIVGSPECSTKNAVEFLIQLLGAYPYMTGFFPTFKGLSVPDLRKDARFAKHADKVWKAIQEEVDNLDDTPNLVDIVQHLARVHFKFNVKWKEFEHADKVWKAIQEEVDHLDVTPKLEDIVQQLARVHFKFNVKWKEFENLKQMFIPYLKSVVGSKCTNEVVASWTKLLTAQNSVVKMTEDECCK